jgi:hypothetical protein
MHSYLVCLSFYRWELPPAQRRFHLQGAKIANGAESAALDKFAIQVVNLLVQTTSGY